MKFKSFQCHSSTLILPYTLQWECIFLLLKHSSCASAKASFSLFQLKQAEAQVSKFYMLTFMIVEQKKFCFFSGIPARHVGMLWRHLSDLKMLLFVAHCKQRVLAFCTVCFVERQILEQSCVKCLKQNGHVCHIQCLCLINRNTFII